MAGLGFLALLWIGFLVLIAKSDDDQQKLIMLAGWGLMALSAVAGILVAIF